MHDLVGFNRDHGKGASSVFRSGECQCCQIPAMPNGSPALMANRNGSLTLALTRFHSMKESAGVRQRRKRKDFFQMPLDLSFSALAWMVSSYNFLRSVQKGGRNRQYIMRAARMPSASSHTTTGCMVPGAAL